MAGEWKIVGAFVAWLGANAVGATNDKQASTHREQQFSNVETRKSLPKAWTERSAVLKHTYTVIYSVNVWALEICK